MERNGKRGKGTHTEAEEAMRGSYCVLKFCGRTLLSSTTEAACMKK